MRDAQRPKIDDGATPPVQQAIAMVLSSADDGAPEHRGRAVRRQWRRTLEGPLRARFDADRVSQSRIEDAAGDGVLILFAMTALATLSGIMSASDPMSGSGALLSIQILASLVVAGIVVALIVGLRLDIALAKCGFAAWRRLKPLPALSRQEIDDWRAALPALTPEGAETLAPLLDGRHELADIRAWIEAEADRRTREAQEHAHLERLKPLLEELRVAGARARQHAQQNAPTARRGQP